MTEERLTPQERAEAKVTEVVERASDHLKSEAKRAVGRIRLFALAYEIVDALPDLLEDDDVRVNWSGEVVIQPCINETGDTAPLLKELADRGYRIKSSMDIDADSETLGWELTSPDGPSVKVSAHFNHNARCRIERVEVGTEHVEAYDRPVYEMKVVCDEEEEEEELTV